MRLVIPTAQQTNNPAIRHLPSAQKRTAVRFRTQSFRPLGARTSSSLRPQVPKTLKAQHTAVEGAIFVHCQLSYWCRHGTGTWALDPALFSLKVCGLIQDL